MEHPLLGSSEWAERSNEGLEGLHSCLGILMLIEPNKKPECIGTLFIVKHCGDHAIAISAAHNFWLAVGNAQKRASARHSLACPLLFADGGINLADNRLRVFYRSNSNLIICVVRHVMWDKNSDLAVLTFSAEDPNAGDVFNQSLRFDDATPKIGDLVGCVGYKKMATVEFSRNWKDRRSESFGLMSATLCFRIGRVLGLHPKGHTLVHGPCIESSIPVFPGMSGGPVFLMPDDGNGELKPFGLISTDPEPEAAEESEKNLKKDPKDDDKQPGASIFSMLPLQMVEQDGSVLCHLRLENIEGAIADSANSKPSPYVSWRPDQAS